MGIQAKTKDEKYEKIKNKKISVGIDTLCKGFPKEFVKYLEYCRNLGFEDKPGYSNLRRMFSDLMNSEGYTYDYQFDWLLKKKDREALLTATPEDEEEKVFKDDEEDKIDDKLDKLKLSNKNKNSESYEKNEDIKETE